jgi:DNA-directed RNA polymerase subunit M/transcription elongation factor TFIIS
MEFTCPKCNAIAVSNQHQAGETIACSSCGTALRLPSSSVPRMELDEDSRHARSVSTELNPSGSLVEDSITQGISSTAEARPEQDPPPRFATQEYQSDNGFNLAGVALMIILEVVAGVFLGAVASLISRLFYLILIFPAAIGMGVGMAGMAGVNIGKVRNVFATGLIGFLGGCVAMFAMHYGDYLHALDQLPQELHSQVSFLD